MIRKICITLACLVVLTGCRHNTNEPVVPRIDSPESALQVAQSYLVRQKTDTTRHDMSEPERIQEITVQGQKAWRVSWKLTNFEGKGGQLVVIVDETGICQQGWGE